jgi:hypothetical protein
MLAKKPIGGFSCASYENYLGELKENDEKDFGINSFKYDKC